MTRHLLYHCCPVAGNDAWRWNLTHLRRRLPLFDGRRLVGLMVGDGLDPPGDVRDLLGSEVEYTELPNALPSGEGVTLRALLPQLVGATGYLWYGHAKGVSQHNQGERVYPVRRWTECCYRSTLDYWPLVEQTLESHPFAGSFRRVGYWVGAPPSWWHYAGTFFWVRLPWLWSQGWRSLADGYGCVERWPGQMCPPHQAGVLFYPMLHDSMRLYTGPWWLRIGDAAWQGWAKAFGTFLQPVFSGE